MTDFKHGLPERLKRLRGARSQPQASRDWGIPLGTLRRYESGENAPDAERIALICEREGISADWLLFGRGEPRRSSAQAEARESPGVYRATDALQVKDQLDADDKRKAMYQYRQLPKFAEKVEFMLNEFGIHRENTDSGAYEMLLWAIAGALAGGAPLSAIVLIGRAISLMLGKDSEKKEGQ